MRAGSAQVGPVRVAWADATAAVRGADGIRARLSLDQQRRSAALSGRRAGRFLRGRALLLGLIDDLAGTSDATLFAHCPRCGSGEHGALQVAGAAVAASLSYAGPLIAVAAVPTAAASHVGVDLEECGASDAAGASLSDLAALWAPAPPPTLAEWTRIEAVLKADGRGFALPPTAVSISATPGGILPESRLARLPGNAQPIDVVTLDAAKSPAGCVLSVAVF